MKTPAKHERTKLKITRLILFSFSVSIIASVGASGLYGQSHQESVSDSVAITPRVAESVSDPIDPVPTTLSIDSQRRFYKEYVRQTPEAIERQTKGIAVRSSMMKKADTQPARNLTILHTNDIHGHLQPWRGWEGELKDKTVGGLDRLAAHIEKVRGEMKANSVLLLDAGDTIGDTLIAAETEGRAVVETMNAMRYDAMVIGNHEPDFTAAKLLDRTKETRFPVLAANVVRKSDGNLYVEPYVIKTVGGVRVGILGLSYPNTPLTSAKRNIDSLTFRDAAGSAREYLPRLRKEGAEIVVALTHLGLQGDKRLAEEVPGFDVIVGGHSHNRMTEAMRVEGTLIVQAGAHGSDLGRLDLTVENGKIVAHRRTLIPVTGPESDKTVAAVIKEQVARHKTNPAEEIGRASSLISRAQTIAGGEPEKRDAESPADSLFADAIRDAAKTEIAFLPGVGYGVAIHPGAITADGLKNLIPHDSAIFTMKLTGSQIWEVLEQAVDNVFTTDTNKKVGGMVQISGLKFAYDPNRIHGDRVQSITVGTRPLERSRLYTVVTNTLLAEGGHDQKTFLEGADKREAGKQYETIKKWIAAKNVIRAAPTGRIRKIEEKNEPRR